MILISQMYENDSVTVDIYIFWGNFVTNIQTEKVGKKTTFGI